MPYGQKTPAFIYKTQMDHNQDQLYIQVETAFEDVWRGMNPSN